jgi:hypothetical protein
MSESKNDSESRRYAGMGNLVVSALGFENRRLGLSVVDIDDANYVLTPIHWRVAIFLFVLMIWKLRIVQRDMAMLGSSL